MANLDFQNGYMVGIAASGTTKSSGVQADWNQNDNSQMSYIQNRPFYSESVTVNDFTITPTGEVTVFDLVPQCEEGEKIKVEYLLNGEVALEAEGTVVNMGENLGVDKLYVANIQSEGDEYGMIIFGAVMTDPSGDPELSDTQSTYLDATGVYEMGADVKIYKSVTTETVTTLPEKFLPSTEDNSFEIVYSGMTPSIFNEKYRLEEQPIWTDPTIVQTLIPYTFNHQHYFTRHVNGNTYNLSYCPESLSTADVIPSSTFTCNGDVADEVAFMENEDGTLEMFNVKETNRYGNYSTVRIPAFSSLEIEVEDTIAVGGKGVSFYFMSSISSNIDTNSYTYIQNNQNNTITHAGGTGSMIDTNISHSHKSASEKVPYMTPYQAKIECTAEKYCIKFIGDVYKQEGLDFPYRELPKEKVDPEERPQYQFSGSIVISKDFIKDSIEKGKPCDTSMFNILMIDNPKADTKITIRGKRA